MTKKKKKCHLTFSVNCIKELSTTHYYAESVPPVREMNDICLETQEVSFFIYVLRGIEICWVWFSIFINKKKRCIKSL